MINNFENPQKGVSLLLFLFAVCSLTHPCEAQTPTSDPTLRELPGYAKFSKVLRQRGRIATGGRAQDIQWSADFTKLSFVSSDGKKVVDLATGKFVDDAEFVAFKPEPVQARRRGSRVPRAEQRPIEPSNNGKWDAVYKDFNVTLIPKDKSTPEVAVTTEGNVKVTIRNRMLGLRRGTFTIDGDVVVT